MRFAAGQLSSVALPTASATGSSGRHTSSTVPSAETENTVGQALAASLLVTV